MTPSWQSALKSSGFADAKSDRADWLKTPTAFGRSESKIKQEGEIRGITADIRALFKFLVLYQ